MLVLPLPMFNTPLQEDNGEVPHVNEVALVDVVIVHWAFIPKDTDSEIKIESKILFMKLMYVYFIKLDLRRANLQNALVLMNFFRHTT